MSPLTGSSTVIQDIENMCKAGNASIAYFYFYAKGPRRRTCEERLIVKRSPSIGRKRSREKNNMDVLNVLFSEKLIHGEKDPQPWKRSRA